MVQLAPPGKVAGATGQSFVCEKSGAWIPSMVIRVITKSALPMLVSTAFCGALLVPWACVAKWRLLGSTVTMGAPAKTVRRKPALANAASPKVKPSHSVLLIALLLLLVAAGRFQDKPLFQDSQSRQ